MSKIENSREINFPFLFAKNVDDFASYKVRLQDILVNCFNIGTIRIG